MTYLDPKNDLTFKKIFGQHPHLLKSFLNAILPLDEDQLIESLEYLPLELVPEIPLLKHSIVDVRCKDNKGRQFIVEMQMFWTENFKSRVVFNASKAYIKQLEKGKEYNSLQPVYALSLVNDIFEHDTNQYYHHYKIVNIENTEKQLHGLEFVFIELPKFPLQSIAEKKLKILWLRFIT
jgi:predicted transposase/invertase (TIGR01784 family)